MSDKNEFGEQKDLAKELAQKEYCKKLLKSVNKELEDIHKFIDGYSEINEEIIISKMHPARRKLISLIQESEEDFIQKWMSSEYKGLTFEKEAPLFLTDNKERVRSKSEVLIANLLNRLNIPYKYECPLSLKIHGSPIPNYTIYPDFTLLDIKHRKEIYYEHFGMMDNANYAEKVVAKLATYQSNGIYVGKNLLVSYETQKQPLNSYVVEDLLRNFFEL